MRAEEIERQLERETDRKWGDKRQRLWHGFTYKCTRTHTIGEDDKRRLRKRDEQKERQRDR